MLQDYLTYTKTDFLQDDFFVRHIKYADNSTTGFWQKYLDLKPANLSAYLDAKEELEYILDSVIRINPSGEDKSAVWSVVQDKIPLAKKRYLKTRMLVRFSVAASVLIALSFSILFLRQYYYGQRQNITTPYTKIREVLLPDSSRIILNANSNIKYAANWRPDHLREVWLKGEAYFEIKHKNKHPENILDNERFVVHTSKIDVQVLGTVFNVKARPKQHSVVLVSGSVAVRKRGERLWHILKPGQEFIYEPDSNLKILNKEDPSLLTAWKDRSVILPFHTRLKDILPQLEENYGVTIKLTSEEIGTRYLEGTLPLTDQENLFFILSNVLKIEISKQDNTWIFKPQNK